MEDEFVQLKVTLRDKIDDLVASYPSCRRLLCEYVTQWLPTVASQCQAIEEAIETDYPCSDDFMQEIGPEQGLPAIVSDGSSSCTRSQVDPPSPDADKASAENVNRIPEPFPTPSSPMGEQSLEDCQDRGHESDGSNRSQVPREPPYSQPPGDYHGVKGNPNKVDVLVAEKACADNTPKPARPKQRLAKRPAERGKEAVSKKKKTTVHQLPTIVNCKSSASDIYGHLLSHYRNPDISWLLARLFFAIASPEAFVQAKDTYRHFQSGNIQIHLSRTSTVSDHMKYLDQLASSFTACRVIERSILVQLVNRRDELVQKFKAEPDRRMRKTTEAKSQSRLQRVDGLALSIMMEEAFPMLKTGADDYNQRRTTLRNRLSKGRNWHILATRFGNGVLALVPMDGEFQIHDRAIQRLGESDFTLLLEVLDERRGNFIRTCSAHMDRLLNLCYEPDPAEKCSLEEVDECLVKRMSYDSPDLVELLKIK